MNPIFVLIPSTDLNLEMKSLLQRWMILQSQGRIANRIFNFLFFVLPSGFQLPSGVIQKLITNDEEFVYEMMRACKLVELGDVIFLMCTLARPSNTDSILMSREYVL